jgi:thiol-disulfide isomerase/thioredoxin
MAMLYLTAAVVLVGVLCVLNLVLTYGVIRRLREHTELLARPAGVSSGMSADIATAGSVVGPFAVSTMSGESLSEGDLAAGTVVGFYAPGCSACRALVPQFVDAAAAHPGGQDRVLAVVVSGPEEDATEYVSLLSPKATVVVAPHGADIEKAFAVSGYPNFALVGAGGVVSASGDLDTVLTAANAAG